MKAIVAGGRDFIPKIKHSQWLQAIMLENGVDTLVSGCCSGADKFGESIAKLLNLNIEYFPADWKTYGRSAGPIRNEQMAKFSDICILFPGGKGTANMKNNAIKYNLKIFKYED